MAEQHQQVKSGAGGLLTWLNAVKLLDAAFAVAKADTWVAPAGVVTPQPAQEQQQQQQQGQ
jgi:hypothetical protein